MSTYKHFFSLLLSQLQYQILLSLSFRMLCMNSSSKESSLTSISSLSFRALQLLPDIMRGILLILRFNIALYSSFFDSPSDIIFRVWILIMNDLD